MLFVVLVLGAIAWAARFNIFRFLAYIKEEILLVLAVSSSEIAIPTLMAKLEKLGCSKSLVGLIVPTGFTFNTDGTSLYMTMAALFVAQATNTHLTLVQELTILSVAVLTSKGASGVQGASFIHRAGGDTFGDSYDTRCRHGINPRNRSLPEYVSSLGEHDWKRSSNACPGTLGGELSSQTLRQRLAQPS